MNTKIFIVSPFDVNLYIVWDENTLDAVAIDPGMMRDEEREMVIRFLEENNLHLTHVLLSHLHVDHICSARWLADKTGCQVWGSNLDAPLGLALPQQAEMFGLGIKTEPLTVDHNLADGDTIKIGEITMRVIHTPGHSQGGLSFYLPEENVLFSGDTIFQSSVGRTDLPGGDMDTLLETIREKILTLPDETVLAPGHGNTTTVVDEKYCNPFL